MTEKRVLYATFVGSISEENAAAFIDEIKEQTNRLGFTHYYIMLATDGGEVDGGIFLYNTLRSLPITVTTHNIGRVESIGNIVFLAGSERIATPGCLFYFHPVSLQFHSRAIVDKVILKEKLDIIKHSERRLKDIYKSELQLSNATLNGFFSRGNRMSADDALHIGLVSTIKPAEIPDSAIHFVFDTYKLKDKAT
jgi:ATP-dependent Clp protease protease subunit